MAEGDLVVSDKQYEFNGLLIGRGSDFGIERLSGLLGSPSVVARDSERQDSHGTWPGLSYVGPRIVTFDVFVSKDSSTSAENALATLEMAYRIENKYRKFVFQRRGLKQYLVAQTRRRDFDADFSLFKGLLKGSVELYCPDPRRYSFAQTSDAGTIPLGGTNIQVNVTNLGNAEAGATITINGPATNLVLTNQDDSNRQIRISGVVAGGSTLIIDIAHRTAVLNGVEAYNLISSNTDWWHLVPGLNRITYSRDDTGAASTITIVSKDVWI